MAAVALLLIVAVVVGLPETHPAERRIPLRVGVLVGSLAQVSRSARFHRVAWAAALTFAGQFIYITSASIVVVDLLGLGELDFWILFAPLVAAVVIGSQISSSAAGRVSSHRLVTASLGFCVLAAGANVALAATAGASLPWAVVGPALLGLGTVAAYPTMQLILLDMFPVSRGSAVSVFTFFTLALNGVIASAVAPFVTGSLLQLALASTVLVMAGAVSWLWHLRGSRTPLPIPPAPVTGG